MSGFRNTGRDGRPDENKETPIVERVGDEIVINDLDAFREQQLLAELARDFGADLSDPASVQEARERHAMRLREIGAMQYTAALERAVDSRNLVDDVKQATIDANRAVAAAQRKRADKAAALAEERSAKARGAKGGKAEKTKQARAALRLELVKRLLAERVGESEFSDTVIEAAFAPRNGVAPKSLQIAQRLVKDVINAGHMYEEVRKKVRVDEIKVDKLRQMHKKQGKRDHDIVEVFAKDMTVLERILRDIIGGNEVAGTLIALEVAPLSEFDVQKDMACVATIKTASGTSECKINTTNVKNDLDALLAKK